MLLSRLTFYSGRPQMREGRNFSGSRKQGILVKGGSCSLTSMKFWHFSEEKSEMDLDHFLQLDIRSFTRNSWVKHILVINFTWSDHKTSFKLEKHSNTVLSFYVIQITETKEQLLPNRSKIWYRWLTNYKCNRNS